MTRPTRDQIAEAIAGREVWAIAWAPAREMWRRRADAVLALMDEMPTAHEVWEAGLDAGRDRWMDAREFGDPPVNPYENGAGQ